MPPKRISNIGIKSFLGAVSGGLKSRAERDLKRTLRLEKKYSKVYADGECALYYANIRNCSGEYDRYEVLDKRADAIGIGLEKLIKMAKSSKDAVDESTPATKRIVKRLVRKQLTKYLCKDISTLVMAYQSPTDSND